MYVICDFESRTFICYPNDEKVLFINKVLASDFAFAKAPTELADPTSHDSKRVRKLLDEMFNNQADACAVITNLHAQCMSRGAIGDGSVYTLYFQHIQSGASLYIECPAISVAQDLWDLLALDTRGIRLQCLRP